MKDKTKDDVMYDLSTVTSEDFQPYLNQTFRIHLSEEEVLEIVLIDIIVLGEQTQPKAAKRRGFSLTFRGPKDVYLPQRLYTVEHEDMGALTLFLVPITPDEEGARFESILN